MPLKLVCPSDNNLLLQLQLAAVNDDDDDDDGVTSLTDDRFH